MGDTLAEARNRAYDNAARIRFVDMHYRGTSHSMRSPWPAEEPAVDGELVRNHEATPIEMLPGITRRQLTEGRHTMLVELRMAAGSHVPAHTHPHEQTGYLASGRFRFRLGERWLELGPGDSWSVPGGVEHEVEVLEDTVAVDIFSPPRDEYRDPNRPPRA
jgi:quercetin dioxygenase-like cupin family protein